MSISDGTRFLVEFTADGVNGSVILSGLKREYGKNTLLTLESGDSILQNSDENRDLILEKLRKSRHNLHYESFDDEAMRRADAVIDNQLLKESQLKAKFKIRKISKLNED